MDLFCDWWGCWFVGLVDCWCFVELLNQGSNCKDVQSWVCQYVIACRQDSDKIDSMMGDIFVGDIGQFDSRLSRCSPIQDYCWPLCNCNWSCGRPGLEHSHACWNSDLLDKHDVVWTTLDTASGALLCWSAVFIYVHCWYFIGSKTKQSANSRKRYFQEKFE